MCGDRCICGCRYVDVYIDRHVYSMIYMWIDIVMCVYIYVITQVVAQYSKIYRKYTAVLNDYLCNQLFIIQDNCTNNLRKE